jgi:6-pyruvoyltetrahydropterin/6-carboxytetrahydropterin synthase
MRITRKYELDMGHCLPDHDGKCYRPHGHRYVVEATVEAELVLAGAERGMVVDFGRLKAAMEQIVGSYDHRFVMCEDDPRREAMLDIFGAEGVATITDPPTAENLAQLWVECLSAVLTVPLVGLRVYETPNCWAEWLPWEVDQA